MIGLITRRRMVKSGKIADHMRNAKRTLFGGPGVVEGSAGEDSDAGD